MQLWGAGPESEIHREMHRESKCMQLWEAGPESEINREVHRESECMQLWEAGPESGPEQAVRCMHMGRCAADHTPASAIQEAPSGHPVDAARPPPREGGAQQAKAARVGEDGHAPRVECGGGTGGRPRVPAQQERAKRAPLADPPPFDRVDAEPR